MKRFFCQLALLLLLILQPAFARADGSTPTMNELAGAMADRTTRVPEFALIRAEAEKLGIHAWLFGGTAAAYGHYVKWDMQRESGDKRFQPHRFDYDYLNIYRSTQDLDIVIDGTAEQAEAMQNKLMEKFPHLQGSKTAWEVRLLKKSMGDKLAILDNPDFLNQHSDSNSTGMVELTKPAPGESAVRDVRDWKSKEPFFLKDVAEGKIHYYFSPTHAATKFAKEGRNPPILSVVRYLTKAFQYQLEMRPEEVEQIKQIIKKFDPQGREMADSYVRNWLLNKGNGRKLVQNAMNMEYAMEVLDDVGLRKKLIAIEKNPGTQGSLAWWLNKKPLPSLPIGNGRGKTAKELGLDVVAHETSDYLAYESIRKPHTGEPNVFVSRESTVGEAAAHGEGFYTQKGTWGARGSGYTIRFQLDPNAREGTDFALASDRYVVVKNRAVLRTVPENLKWTLADYLGSLLADKSFSHADLGIFENLTRKVENNIPSLSAEERIASVLEAVDSAKAKGAFSSDNLEPFFAKHPEVKEAFLQAFRGMSPADWEDAIPRFLNPESKALLPALLIRTEPGGQAATVQMILHGLESGNITNGNFIHDLLNQDPALPKAFENAVSHLDDFRWRALMASLWNNNSAPLFTRLANEAHGRSKATLGGAIADAVLYRKDFYMDQRALDGLRFPNGSPLQAALADIQALPFGEIEKVLASPKKEGGDFVSWLLNNDLAPAHAPAYEKLALDYVEEKLPFSYAVRSALNARGKKMPVFSSSARFHDLVRSGLVGTEPKNWTRLSEILCAQDFPNLPLSAVFDYILIESPAALLRNGRLNSFRSFPLDELFQPREEIEPRLKALLQNFAKGDLDYPLPEQLDAILGSKKVKPLLVEELDKMSTPEIHSLLKAWSAGIAAKGTWNQAFPTNLLDAFHASRHWNLADPALKNLLAHYFDPSITPLPKLEERLAKYGVQPDPALVERYLKYFENIGAPQSVLPVLEGLIPAKELEKFREPYLGLLHRSSIPHALEKIEADRAAGHLSPSLLDKAYSTLLTNIADRPSAAWAPEISDKLKALITDPNFLRYPDATSSLAQILPEAGAAFGGNREHAKAFLPQYRLAVTDPNLVKEPLVLANYVKGLGDYLSKEDAGLFFDRLAKMTKDERESAIRFLWMREGRVLNEVASERFGQDPHYRLTPEDFQKIFSSEKFGHSAIGASFQKAVVASMQADPSRFAAWAAAANPKDARILKQVVQRNLLAQPWIRDHEAVALQILKDELAMNYAPRGFMSGGTIPSEFTEAAYKAMAAPNAPDWPEVLRYLKKNSTPEWKQRLAAISSKPSGACAGFFKMLGLH